MIENIGKYYLYRHIRKDTGQPFYIGIGSKLDKLHSKVKSEYSRAFCIHRENNFWKSIVEKADYDIEIILESDDYDFVKQKEIEFINLYGRRNLNTGILSNLTDGGEGVKGRVPTDEWRKNQSNKMKGRKGISGKDSPLYGTKQSEELIEKRMKNIRGKPFTKEHSENISKSRIEKGTAKGKNNPMYGKTKELAPKAVQIIDIITLEVFPCLLCASEHYRINKSTLSGYLNNRIPNKTNLRYKKDFEHLL
jgi:hypothetical protein